MPGDLKMKKVLALAFLVLVTMQDSLALIAAQLTNM
jgi:hypothetical protein